MALETFFLLGIFISIVLIFESIRLRKNEGRLDTVLWITTTLEMGWFILCIYALFAIDMPYWAMLLPAAYIVYFIIAIQKVSSSIDVHDVETMEDINNMAFPMSFVRMENRFGIAYLIAFVLAWLLTL